jgi:hypothetical protein
MKFVSKNSNLRIVLRPGIPANQMSGIAGQPGVYVKFQNGIVDIKDEEMIEKMHAHPGFNVDFIAVDENGEDPFAANRQEIEPVHVIQDIKYGHAENKRVSPNAKAIIDPRIQKLVDDLAIKKATEMLPKMVEETVKKMMEIGAAKAEKAKAEKEDNSKAAEAVEEKSELSGDIGDPVVVEAPIKRSAGRPKSV